MLSFYLFRLAAWLLPHVPKGFLRWAEQGIGSAAFLTMGGRRRVVSSNIRHVLGPDAQEAIVDRTVRGVFQLWIRNLVDLFLLPSLSGEEIERLVDVRGWQNVEAALARGKGLVISSIHFGMPDTPIQILALRGLRPVVLHERLEPPELYRLVSGFRSAHGLQFVPVGDNSALKLIIRTLRGNGVVGVAADRDVTDSGRPVLFFGSPAKLPYGHVSLALRTGAALMMAICHVLPDDRFEVVIEPEIELQRTGNTEADIDAAMTHVVAAMERHIGQTPEQWVYFHPVWLD